MTGNTDKPSGNHPSENSSTNDENDQMLDHNTRDENTIEPESDHTDVSATQDESLQKDLTETDAGNSFVEEGNTTEESAPEPQSILEEKSETVVEKKSSPLIKVIIAIVIFLLLLLIAGLAIGAYYGWDEYQRQQQRVAALETYADEQNSQTKTLNQQQAELIKQQAVQLSALQKEQVLLLQRVDSHTQRISGLAGTSREDWLLAEVRYLLRLANQRLLVEQGTLGAQGLLESADKILSGIDDNGLMPVREAVANEIIALKLADTVDKEGLYLRLSALKTQIQSLPLIPFITTDENTGTTDEPEENLIAQEPLQWYETIFNSIKNTFANIGDLIQIRQHDQTPDLLISEQQQYQVINHLSLMLEQAQYALLHGEKEIYRDSLSKATDWWSTYYGHYKEHEAVKAELDSFKRQAITQTLPDISRSSRLISDYIEQFHRINSSTTVIKNTPENKEETTP